MDSIYHEFALLLMVSALVGAVAVRLRQPLLVAYIIVGIVVGPAVFGWVEAHDQIDLLAQIGITVLLFVVGLKLDLHHIRHIGPVALATGLGQLSFTILFGFFIILALGKGWLEALYVAVALTFSSTIIIVKLLVRQARARFAARPHRGRLPHRAGPRRGDRDDDHERARRHGWRGGRWSHPRADPAGAPGWRRTAAVRV